MAVKRKRASTRIVQQKKTKQDVMTNDQGSATDQIIDQENLPITDKTRTQGTQYFLMKSEPDSRIEKGKDVKFSIDDLKKVQVEPWDGVRNREASRTMRERMKKDDLIMFYHSNTKFPGIAGIARVHEEGYPDESAFEPNHPYYDPMSDPRKPKWYRIDYVRHLKHFISLKQLRADTSGKLDNMVLLRRPQLSVQIVTEQQWNHILELEQTTSDEALNSSSIGSTAKEESYDATGQVTTQELDRQTMEEIHSTHGGPP